MTDVAFICEKKKISYQDATHVLVLLDILYLGTQINIYITDSRVGKTNHPTTRNDRVPRNNYLRCAMMQQHIIPNLHQYVILTNAKEPLRNTLKIMQGKKYDSRFQTIIDVQL